MWMTVVGLLTIFVAGAFTGAVGFMFVQSWAGTNRALNRTFAEALEGEIITEKRCV